MKKDVDHHHANTWQSTTFRQATVAKCRCSETTTLRRNLRAIAESAPAHPRITPNGMPSRAQLSITTTLGKKLKAFWMSTMRPQREIPCFNGPKNVRPNLPGITVGATPIETKRKRLFQRPDGMFGMERSPTSIQDTKHRNGTEIQHLFRASGLCKTWHSSCNNLLRPLTSEFSLLKHAKEIVQSPAWHSFQVSNGNTIKPPWGGGWSMGNAVWKGTYVHGRPVQGSLGPKTPCKVQNGIPPILGDVTVALPHPFPCAQEHMGQLMQMYQPAKVESLGYQAVGLQQSLTTDNHDQHGQPATQPHYKLWVGRQQIG